MSFIVIVDGIIVSNLGYKLKSNREDLIDKRYNPMKIKLGQGKGGYISR